MMPTVSASGFWEGVLLLAVLVGYPLSIPLVLGLTIRSIERRWRHTSGLPAGQRLSSVLTVASVVIGGVLAATVNLWAAALTTVIIINAWGVIDAVISRGTSPALRSERATVIGTRLTLALWLVNPILTTRALFYAALGLTVGLAVRRVATTLARDASVAVSTLGALLAGFTTDLIARSDQGFLRLVWTEMPITTIAIAAVAALAAMLYAGLAAQELRW